MDGCKYLQFQRMSELERHKLRHTRPFACPEQDCHVMSFGDKAGLQRHCREVHGHDENGFPVPRYRCPKRNCKRNRRGFPRQSNMIEHYRRIHSGSSSKTIGVLSPRELADACDSADIPPENAAAEETNSSVATCSTPTPFDNVSDSALQGCLRQQLELELRKLHREKDSVNTKLNKKIEAVLTILSGVREEVQDCRVWRGFL